MTAERLVIDPTALAARLARLGENGIACIHQAELGDPEAPPGGVLRLLGDLGLLDSLRTRILPCQEHDCPLIPSCPYVTDFARDASSSRSDRPKSGRKFQANELTRQLVADPELLARFLPSHPIAQWLAARFAECPDWTVFALAEAWLEAALADQEPAGTPAQPRPTDFAGTRRELAACVALLVGLGWLAWENEGRNLRLVQRWW
jgi:hypothetical protein